MFGDDRLVVCGRGSNLRGHPWREGEDAGRNRRLLRAHVQWLHLLSQAQRGNEEPEKPEGPHGGSGMRNCRCRSKRASKKGERREQPNIQSDAVSQPEPGANKAEGWCLESCRGENVKFKPASESSKIGTVEGKNALLRAQS